MFTGCFTALITPFKDGSVDEEALKRHVEKQIEAGVSGLVPCGTTGESATLDYEEHKRVIELTIETAGGRVPVIAGTGSNSTTETIMLTRHAESAGADAALLISPYYNKPSQSGVYEHYKCIAESTKLPLLLYNVPGRTALNMHPKTIARLSKLDNIVGVKEATGSLAQVSDIIEYSKKGFLVISGDDFITYPLLTVGGHGVISVTSNVVPADVSAMCGFYYEGKLEESLKLHYRLQRLNRAMFLETNPVPVKTALAMMGLVEEEFRLPLVAMEPSKRAELERELKDYGLI